MSNISCPFLSKIDYFMTKIIQGNVCLKNSVLALVPKQNEGQGHFKITLQQYRIRFTFSTVLQYHQQHALFVKVI